MELKNVRSLRKGETSLEEICQILNASKLEKRTLDYYLKDSADNVVDTVVCDGDLVMDGDFDPYDFNVCNLIVKGSLTVSGLMTFYSDPQTLVFVGGDLHADDLVAGDTLEVCGNLNIKNAIVCMESEPMYIHGDLNALFFLPGDAILTVGNNRNIQKAYMCQHRISDKNAMPYLSDRDLYLLLKNNAFDSPIDMDEALGVEEAEWDDYPFFDYVNTDGVIEMLRKRQSIYRNQ